MVRSLRREVEPVIVIRLQDGLQLAVPSWMLDPSRCESIRDEAEPVIAVEALRELVALVDQQRLSLQQDGDSPSSSNHQRRGSDEQRSVSPSTVAEQT